MSGAVTSTIRGPDVREENVNLSIHISDYSDETFIPQGTIVSLETQISSHQGTPGIGPHSSLTKPFFHDAGLDQKIAGFIKTGIQMTKEASKKDILVTLTQLGLHWVINAGSLPISVGDNVIAGPAVRIQDRTTNKSVLATYIKDENRAARRWTIYPASRVIFVSEARIMMQNAVLAAALFDEEAKKYPWTCMPYLGAIAACRIVADDDAEFEHAANDLVKRFAAFLRGPSIGLPADAVEVKGSVHQLRVAPADLKVLSTRGDVSLFQTISYFLEQQNAAGDTVAKYKPMWLTYIGFLGRRIMGTAYQNIPVGNSGYVKHFM